MPIEDFEHFSLSLGYPELYYKTGDVETARETAETLITIFQQNLRYYSTFSDNDIALVIENIDANLYMYRNVLIQVTQYDNDEKYAEQMFNDFVLYKELFRYLMPEDAMQMPLEEELIQELDTIKP
jgi:hypothetical protein